MKHVSHLQILGNLTHLKIDHHEINSLDKDIFFESAANERLERLHLSNGRIGELMSESFQVWTNISFRKPNISLN